MPRSHKEVEALLIKLELCLRNSCLWSQTKPTKEALASKTPFAYDTMPLENWLQFIFIPQMLQLMSINQLPKSLSLQPIAQMHFSKVKNGQALLTTIEQIDELFND